jgi:hypothetical protein
MPADDRAGDAEINRIGGVSGEYCGLLEHRSLVDELPGVAIGIMKPYLN